MLIRLWRAVLLRAERHLSKKPLFHEKRNAEGFVNGPSSVRSQIKPHTRQNDPLFLMSSYPGDSLHWKNRTQDQEIGFGAAAGGEILS